MILVWSCFWLLVSLTAAVVLALTVPVPFPFLVLPSLVVLFCPFENRPEKKPSCLRFSESSTCLAQEEVRAGG